MANKQPCTMTLDPNLILELDSIAFQHDLSRSAVAQRILAYVACELKRPELHSITIKKRLLERTLDV